ncbi:hypothetical protein PS681_01223 [Pseudomonas fluorescens]|nr:hypothetical protein PS681_01223 [Pseudomonas fluorescens]
MHQTFVDLQRAHVAIVEHRVGTDLDVIGARCGVSNNAVRLEHANGFLGLAKDLVQTGLQQVHSVFGGEGFRLVFQIASAIDVVQVVGHHQAEVGQRRVTGVKGIGRSPVQLLRDQAEILGAARFEHAHHHAVFLAHAPHDLPDRVELAELAGDVALDVLEFQFDLARVETQRSIEVVVAIHRRHFLAFGLEEALADILIPLDRVEHTDRCLRQHNAVGQYAYRLLVIVHPKLL